MDQLVKKDTETILIIINYNQATTLNRSRCRERPRVLLGKNASVSY